MRVLQVNATYHHGGGETVARQLRAGSARAGHDAALLVAYGKRFERGAGVVPMYPRLLSRLHSSRAHGVTERLFQHDAWTDRTMRHLAGSRWDVVHVHNFHGDYARIETLAALAHQKPVVWTFHGSWGFTGGCDEPAGCERYQDECGQCPLVGRWSFLQTDRTREQLQRKLATLRDAPIHVVSPSRWLAAKIAASQVGARWDVRVIPNGVDTALFRSERRRGADFRRSLDLDPAAPVVLLVNRDFKDVTKGFALARKALLAAAESSVQVVLAGHNAEWAAASLPGVRTRPLGFVASRQQLAHYYEAADVLLFPSLDENFPCAVLEAMSAGCCVVSTPTAGASEQIEHGHTGVLAAGIDADALAGALGCVLEDAGLRRRCGEAAATRAASEFGEQRMVDRYLDLYREILSTPPCH